MTAEDRAQIRAHLEGATAASVLLVVPTDVGPAHVLLDFTDVLEALTGKVAPADAPPGIGGEVASVGLTWLDT